MPPPVDFSYSCPDKGSGAVDIVDWEDSVLNRSAFYLGPETLGADFMQTDLSRTLDKDSLGRKIDSYFSFLL